MNETISNLSLSALLRVRNDWARQSAAAALDRSDDLDTIHGDVANLVLATLSYAAPLTSQGGASGMGTPLRLPFPFESRSYLTISAHELDPRQNRP